MRNRIVLYLGFLIAAVAYGQTGHKVALTATSSDVSSTNPGTVTFYRASGQCPSSGIPTGAVALNASPIAFTGSATYTDTPTAGNYCYYAIGQVGGVSGDSNTFLGSVSITVVLTGVVQ